MALASSLPRMSTGSGSSSSSSSASSFLLHKTDPTISDGQFLDILLADHHNNENKTQAVNRWCKNTRRNRLSTILDVSQRHTALLSLISILQQTTNPEYHYNCLTLLLEIQANIYHHDQHTYLPGLFETSLSERYFLSLFSLQRLFNASPRLPMIFNR
jgi:hypothetical protein